MEDLLTDIEVQPRLAAKSRRWVAALIDYFIYTVIVLIISYAFGKAESDETGSITWSLTGWPAFFGAVFPWFLLIPGIEGINKGQTIGKALLRVRAVRENGVQFTFVTAILRHILDFVDYFPFFGIVGLIVASSSKNNKRIGDMVGNTIVVEA